MFRGQLLVKFCKTFYNSSIIFEAFNPTWSHDYFNQLKMLSNNGFSCCSLHGIRWLFSWECFGINSDLSGIYKFTFVHENSGKWPSIDLKNIKYTIYNYKWRIEFAKKEQQNYVLNNR